jgi:hypothetical protein
MNIKGRHINQFFKGKIKKIQKQKIGLMPTCQLANFIVNISFIDNFLALYCFGSYLSSKLAIFHNLSGLLGILGAGEFWLIGL